MSPPSQVTLFHCPAQFGSPQAAISFRLYGLTELDLAGV